MNVNCRRTCDTRLVFACAAVWLLVLGFLVAETCTLSQVCDGVSILVFVMVAASAWRRRVFSRQHGVTGVACAGVTGVALAGAVAWGLAVAGFSRAALVAGVLGLSGLTLLTGSGWHARDRAMHVLALLLAIPWADDFSQWVGLPIRLFAATVTADGYRALGYAVFKAGTVVSIPGFSMAIEPACSGLGFMRVLLVGVAGLALFLMRTGLGRLALLAAVLPVALAANICRIATVGLAGNLFGAKTAERVFHDYGGVVFYVVALAGAMEVCRWVVRRELDWKMGEGFYAIVRVSRRWWPLWVGAFVGVGMWADVWFWMIGVWRTAPKDGQAFLLVVFVCVCAVRCVLRMMRMERTPIFAAGGLAWLCSSFLLRASGVVLDVNVAGPFSGLLFAVGLIWFVGGRQSAWRFVPVWLCLFFLIPGSGFRAESLMVRLAGALGCSGGSNFLTCVPVATASGLIVLACGLVVVGCWREGSPGRVSLLAFGTVCSVFLAGCLLGAAGADQVWFGTGILVKPVVVAGWLAGLLLNRRMGVWTACRLRRSE